VIGSGFGGLAVAIRLQNAGFDTVLYEQSDKAGGRAYVFEDQGFTFDAGPTVITAPECLEELFTNAGQKLSDHVELMPVTPFYRLLWEDGASFDYTGDSEHMLDQIRRTSPGDERGYLEFVAYAKKVFDKGYRELAAVPFLKFSDMVRVAPALIKLRADRSLSNGTPLRRICSRQRSSCQSESARMKLVPCCFKCCEWRNSSCSSLVGPL